MTKPDDIPQDVLATAREVLDGYLYSKMSPDEAIARAIMAERSRQESLVNLLQKDRERMSQDWCDFCETIGVDIDTHDAVADAVMTKFESTATLNSGINQLVGSIIRQPQ